MVVGGKEQKVVWSSKGLMLMGKKEPRAAPYSLVVVAAAPGYTRNQPDLPLLY